MAHGDGFHMWMLELMSLLGQSWEVPGHGRCPPGLLSLASHLLPNSVLLCSSGLVQTDLCWADHPCDGLGSTLVGNYLDALSCCCLYDALCVQDELYHIIHIIYTSCAKQNYKPLLHVHYGL